MQRPVKPEAVVINTPQNENLLAAAPISLPAGRYSAQQVVVSSILQKKRIQFASIVLFVSMFFQWGYHYWLNWTLSSVSSRDGEGWDDGSHNTLWDYLMYGDFAWEGGIGFVEILNFFFRFQIWGDVADLVGPVFALFIMREINIELNGSDYWEFNLFFDCFGFWLAGFAGLLLDPKLIRIPENIGFHKETFVPHLNQPEWVQNSNVITNAPQREANSLVFAGLYFPLIYHLITVIGVMGGGDDDALFLGIIIPIVGLLVGIGVYRLEFLKGFGIHLGYSIGYGFMVYFFMITGLFGLVVEVLEEGTIFLFFVFAFIMPIRYHLKSRHIRALGATYTIPLTIWIMFIGLIIGWIQVEGW